jgi:UDP:flavonoid glycosyltransferase YjiC (YdhE family)
MRVLIVSGALHGHVNTTLPLALAAQQGGHEVAFATGPEFAPALARRGLVAWPVGPTHAQAGGNRQESWLAYFEATAERRAAELVPRAVAWKPDLVVHEETELSGPVVAALSGAKHVVHGLGVMPPRRIWPPFLQAVDRLGQRWGVADLATTLPHAQYLHLAPPSLHTGDAVPWPHVLPLRPVGGLPFADERLPECLLALPRRHTVLVTLGTVFNANVDVLARTLMGLASLDANIVVTVGPDGDPQCLGAQPEHVVIERYMPFTLLMPRCSLVVSHGGAGTLLGALAHGLPQLVLPQGADQFIHAEVAQASGAALALAPGEVTAEAISTAARRLLEEQGFVAAVRRVRAEIEAMPDAADVMQRITRAPALKAVSAPTPSWLPSPAP